MRTGRANQEKEVSNGEGNYKLAGISGGVGAQVTSAATKVRHKRSAIATASLPWPLLPAAIGRV